MYSLPVGLELSTTVSDPHSRTIQINSLHYTSDFAELLYVLLRMYSLPVGLEPSTIGFALAHNTD